MNNTDKRRASARTLKRKRYKQRMYIRTALVVGLVLIACITAKMIIKTVRAENAVEPVVQEYVEEEKKVSDPPEYTVDLLTVNPYSRPGTALEQVNGIVIHYTANPGTTAKQNRDYFEGLSLSGETSASSHFVIGIDGEIVQCIPCNEIAYASNDRNADTIAIECCIPDETGRFTEATYDTLLHLAAWLMGRYDLTIDDVIRHYDVTGKDCPKYYVENPSAWEQMKADISDYIDKNGT